MKIEEIYQSLKDPSYIGEDGDMCVNAPNEKEALKRFKNKVAEDDGEPYEGMDESSIGITYLHLATDEDKKRFKDSEVEWFVDHNKKSPYKLFYYYLG